MPIPRYDQFIEPLLRHLAAHPDGARTAEIYDALASSVGLSEQQREELLPSGVQPVYENRIGWAHDRLKRAGLSSSPRRGFWKLTDGGGRYVADHPKSLTEQDIERLARVSADSRRSPKAHADAVLCGVNSRLHGA